MKSVKYLLLVLLVLISRVGVAQITTQDADVPPAKAESNKKPAPIKSLNPTEKGWKWANFYVGGLPGFGISTWYVNVDAAVEAGYFVHPRVALGWQTTYSYILDKYYNVSYNVIRFGPYARGYIWNGIFAQAQYELTSIKNYHDITSGQVYPTLNNNSLLLGAGYHENYESGFGFYFIALFNVVNSSTALSSNPDFRVGLTYRLNGGGYKNHRKKNTHSAIMPSPNDR